jgi:hypothetical protein
MDAMLRIALGKYTRLRQQVENVLLGDEGDKWESELKKFLAKRPCWKGDQPAKTYTCPISDGHILTLPADDGIRTIAQASDVFSYIDSDFKNGGLYVLSEPTPDLSVVVREMIRGGDFKTIFGELGDIACLCLTQGQIIDFARLYMKWLRTGGYGTFFLFQKDGQLFVARVRVDSVGRLEVDEYRFLQRDVWDTMGGLRIVVPQLRFDLC